MRKILMIAAGAILLASCSALKHKEKDKSKTTVDSSASAKQESSFLDTGKVRTYERIHFMFPSAQLPKMDYTPFDSQLPGQAEALGNVGSSLEDFKSFLEAMKGGMIPMYYERSTEEHKGASGTNKSDSKTEVKKKDSEVHTTTETNNIPIYVGLAIIILILIFKKK